MDIDEIRELVRLMVDNDLAELDITDGDSKVRLKRGVEAPAPAHDLGEISRAIAAKQVLAEAVGAVDEDLIEIKSPMVGTFYSAESSDSDPYITIGSAVVEDTVVCILEAMKVMNEIKAECAGTIVEICVKNAQPVEYGQVLFKVKPS